MKRLFLILSALIGVAQTAQAMTGPFMGALRNFGTQAAQQVRTFHESTPDKATRALKYTLLGTTFGVQCSLVKDVYGVQVDKKNPYEKFIASTVQTNLGEQKPTIFDQQSIMSPRDIAKLLEEEALQYVHNNSTIQEFLQHKHARYVPVALAGVSFVMNMFFMKNIVKAAMTRFSLFEKCCRKAVGIDYPQVK